MNQLIVRISDYIFQNSRKVRKEVRSIMGGNILELESEKLIAKGEVLGEEKLRILISYLIRDNRSDEIQLLVADEDKRKALYTEYHL